MAVLTGIVIVFIYYTGKSNLTKGKERKEKNHIETRIGHEPSEVMPN